MTVKITIDRDGCVQCGNCYNEDCPTLFAEGDDGTSEIQSGFREEGDLAKGNAPDDMEECASKAAKGCPASVITVSK